MTIIWDGPNVLSRLCQTQYLIPMDIAVDQWFSTFLAHTNIKKHLYLEVFKTQKIYDLQTKSSNFPQSID